MKTEVLLESNPEALTRAVETLNRGGVIAFPTDTVYGVGAIASQPEAVGRIYQVKERDHGKALPVMIAAPSDLSLVADQPSGQILRLAKAFWPGPLTMVVRRNSRLAGEISPLDTVGVRIPDYPFLLELLSAVGPMAVTSANRSGGPNPGSGEEVIKALGGRIDLLIDGGETPGDRPSTVVDLSSEQPRILREGPITLDALLAAWQGTPKLS